MNEGNISCILVRCW